MAIEICKSLRRKNLVAMDIETNLVKEADGTFSVRYGRIDVKTKSADIEAQPRSLTLG